MTCEKIENDTCVYVDNSVDLVDFLEVNHKKAENYPHIHKKEFCKFTCRVLDWSMSLTLPVFGQRNLLRGILFKKISLYYEIGVIIGLLLYRDSEARIAFYSAAL